MAERIGGVNLDKMRHQLDRADVDSRYRPPVPVSAQMVALAVAANKAAEALLAPWLRLGARLAEQEAARQPPPNARRPTGS